MTIYQLFFIGALGISVSNSIYSMEENHNKRKRNDQDLKEQKKNRNDENPKYNNEISEELILKVKNLHNCTNVKFYLDIIETDLKPNKEGFCADPNAKDKHGSPLTSASS